MYLRAIRRKNKNGTTTEYLQLARNRLNPETGKISAKVIYSFGRSDRFDRNELIRLCRSITRVCDVDIVKKGDLTIASCPVDAPPALPQTYAKNADIAALKQALADMEAKAARLQESEEKLRTIFNTVNDEIVYLDRNGVIIEINDKVEDLFGYKREEVIGKNFAELRALSPDELEKHIDIFNKTINGTPHRMEEVDAFHKDGAKVFIEANASVICDNDRIKGLLLVIRDITERKRTEAALKRYRDHLEEIVKERTNNLEEANIALKVLLKRREKDKAELEESILANVKEMVQPFLEKLRGAGLNEKQQSLADIVLFNLNDIISPFVKTLSSKYLGLTAMEIKVANLIIGNKTTKEIAGLLAISPRTVDIHRHNIRRKLGINNKKANLATHLLTLQ